VRRKRENTLAHRMVERFGIVASLSQEARELSGGNQQKLIMSRWLLGEARVIIFDEPTKGIDIGAKQEIYRFMTELASNGKLIIMISSDMPELIAMSDRIIVMNKGRITNTLQKAEITEENILSCSIGGR
jgi:ABC-type sugar transport system ATPase subunit